MDDEIHAQAAYKDPVSASPPVMKPKSYATVAKALVVAAARPQPAAVPKRRVAASMPSADLKPITATACKLAVDKVMHAHGKAHECATRVLFPSCAFARGPHTIYDHTQELDDIFVAQNTTTHEPTSALRETRCESHGGTYAPPGYQPDISVIY